MTQLFDDHNKFRAKIFKALADPIRLDIVLFLNKEEKCVCEIVSHLDIVQPLVSRHLKILRESGIIKGRKDGTKRLYKITDEKIILLINNLSNDFLSKLSHVAVEEIF